MDQQDPENEMLNMKSLLQATRKLKDQIERHKNQDVEKSALELANEEKQKKKEAEVNREKEQEKKLKDEQFESKAVEEGVPNSELHPFARHWATDNLQEFFDDYNPNNHKTAKLTTERGKKEERKEMDTSQNQGGENQEKLGDTQATFSYIYCKFKSTSQFVSLQKNMHDNYGLTYAQIERKSPHTPSLYNYSDKDQEDAVTRNKKLQEEETALQKLRLPVSKDLVVRAKQQLGRKIKENEPKVKNMVEKLKERAQYFDISYHNELISNKKKAHSFLSLLKWTEEGMRFEVCGGLLFSFPVDSGISSKLEKPDYFSKFLDKLPQLAKRLSSQDELTQFYKRSRESVAYRHVQQERSSESRASGQPLSPTRSKSTRTTIERKEDKENEEDALKREVDRTIREEINPIQNSALVQIMKKSLRNSKGDSKKMGVVKDQLSRIGIEIIRK